ncbi:MAG: hypothetical protein MJ142_01895 [Clostridia bacterium]|nr:hypothetical protein [Clostridia bacterium]
MLKKQLLCLLLAVCLLLLCSCQPKEVFPTELPVQNQAAQPVETAVSSQDLFGVPFDFDDGTYDPASEDVGIEWEDSYDYDYPEVPVVTSAPTMNSEYAGATPVIIDPIDKPTPTPLPALSFDYVTYEAASMHLMFEAPSGWIVDDSQPNQYVLTNPDPYVDYAASMIISATEVSKKLNKSGLTAELKDTLKRIRSAGLKNFEQSNVADRTLLGADAVYANYTANLKDGTQIAGRVIMCCLNKTVYTLHCSYPRGYRDTYTGENGPYNRFRHSVKLTK